MPLYSWRCRSCSATGDYFETVENHANSPACDKCGGTTRQRLTGGFIRPDIPEYISPATGKLIRGRRQRQYDLESSGSREYEGFETESREAAKRRKEIEAREDKKLDETVHRVISDLDASNRLTRKGSRDDQLPDNTGVRVYG